MAGSYQNEIPPARINLKLDFVKGNSCKKVELPFKILVMGNFSQKKHDQRVSDMEKIAINKNNFEQVMIGMDLSMNFVVDDKISGIEGNGFTVF